MNNTLTRTAIDLTEAVVEVPGVDGHRDKRILGPLSLSIEKGQHVAVLGPNGAGKTTLMKLLAGLRMPTSGTVFVSKSATVGLLFQRPRLFPWLNVAQNICMPLTLRGDGRSDQSLTEMMDILGLKEYADHMPIELSGGYQARVALARALIIPPDFLCCDEPFASLDPCTRLALYPWLKSLLGRSNSTLVLASHSVEEALALAQRVMVCDGPPLKVVHDELLSTTEAKVAYCGARERLFGALQRCLIANNSRRV